MSLQISSSAHRNNSKVLKVLKIIQNVPQDKHDLIKGGVLSLKSPGIADLKSCYIRSMSTILVDLRAFKKIDGMTYFCEGD